MIYSLILLSLFRSILLYVIFGGLYLLMNYSISSNLLNLWALRCSECSLMTLIIFLGAVVVTFASFLILAVCVFPLLFLVSLAWNLSILLSFSVKQIIHLVDFHYWLSVFNLMISFLKSLCNWNYIYAAYDVYVCVCDC